MTAANIHLQKIKEHLEELEDAIRIGLEKRPATIGMHTSAGAVELLELYLHTTNRIAVGKMIKHEWFKRPRPEQKTVPIAERMLGVSFPQKENIFEFMYSIEEHRNKLVYGKPTLAEVRAVIDSFSKLKEILKEVLEQEGVHIEA